MEASLDFEPQRVMAWINSNESGSRGIHQCCVAEIVGDESDGFAERCLMKKVMMPTPSGHPPPLSPFRSIYTS